MIKKNQKVIVAEVGPRDGLQSFPRWIPTEDKVRMLDLLSDAGLPVIEVTSFFNLVMVWNTGASFGLFSSQSLWTQVILVGLAIFFSIFLIVWLRRTRSVWLSIALGLIIGGALGNAIDRMVYSAVADFLDFHVFEYHWPSFNVADIAISLGVIILLIDGFTGRRGRHKFKNSLDIK